MKYILPVLLISIGVILLILSIVLPIGFPTLYETQLSAKLIIQPGSEMLKRFADPPSPIYYQVRLFNITNADGILKGEKPVVTQFGPYTYRNVKRKINIKFNHDYGTVNYDIKKFYFFEPKMSNGSESDMITTVNPVYMTLSAKIHNSGIDALSSIAQLMFMRFKYEPFVTRTVKELLFDGYKDEVVEELYKMTKESKYESGRFGYLYPKNGSIGDNMEIYTGELDMSVYQLIVKYAGMKELPYWQTSYCNKINGTDGSQFPRPVNKDQVIYFYVADVCRSLYAIYEKDVYLGPLKLSRFVIPADPMAFDDVNRCFCSDRFSCRQSMINVSPCRDGAPIVMSTPHFYYGKEEDINQVEGLHPVKEVHETYLDIEPTTGVTMRVCKRIQVNIAFKKYGTLALTNASEVIMPILWVDEQGEAALASAELLYSKLTVPQKAVHYGAWAVFAISIVLIITGVILYYKSYKREKASRVIQRSTDEDGRATQQRLLRSK